MNGRLLSKDLEKYIGTTVVPVTMDGGRGNEALQTIAEGAASLCILIQCFLQVE